LSPLENAGWQPDDTLDRPLRIAVVALPSFSNFTDFDALRTEPSVSLRFGQTAEHLRHADIIILPGSKQTVDDLLWMRARGLDRAIIEHARTGLVAGICGGMQMLGDSITDPLGIERDGTVEGLGLLPIRTAMQALKVTSLARGTLAAASLFGHPIPSVQLFGYEIHIGETTYLDDAEPFADITRGTSSAAKYHDGCIAAEGRVFGTYLHGIFDHDGFRHTFIHAARAFYRLAPADRLEDWKATREASLNRLAAEVEQALDMKTIFAWAGVEL
jgi:adenosylcobyric acid synthase